MYLLRPPAKINLSLEVLGRRPDGFHDLISVMQTVGVWDDLALHPADGLHLWCSDPAIEADNLVLRTAKLLRAAAGIQDGVSMTLHKRIPVAAGLGGGSSDAAAALTGLTRLWNLNLDRQTLCRVAADVGSDVPFFLDGGTALVTGRGEHVRPLRPPRPEIYLLINPRIAVSTARVFAALTPTDWSDGRVTADIAHRIQDGRPAGLGVNSLQATLFRLYPETRACFETVAALHPLDALVSGSGPTVVARFPTRDDGLDAQTRLEASGYWTAVVDGPV